MNQNIGRSKAKTIEDEKYSTKIFEQNIQIQHRGYRPCALQGKKPGVLNNLEFNIRKFQRQKYSTYNGKFVSDKSDDQACYYPRGPSGSPAVVIAQWFKIQIPKRVYTVNLDMLYNIICLRELVDQVFIHACSVM